MDQLTLLAIFGTVTGLGALLVAFYEQWANKDRRKGLLAIGVILLATGVLLSFVAVRRNASQPDTRNVSRTDTASPAPRPTNGPGAETPPRTEPAPPTQPAAPDPAPPSPARPYDSWIRSEGLTIVYDARRWIDGGCTDGTMALGDFSPGGWGSGPEVQCRPDGWLAFDTRPLLESPRFYLDHTYCLNFRNNLGNWGQHGGRQRAPGMDEIGVPAAEGADVGINIGFRINRTGDGYALEFTRTGITSCQS